MVGTNVTETTSMMGFSVINPWILTTIIFIAIVIMIFFISQNFRKLIYGGVITLGGLLIYWISKTMAFNYVEGDGILLMLGMYVVGFIIISVFVGHYFLKLKIGKKIEKYFNQ